MDLTSKILLLPIRRRPSCGSSAACAAGICTMPASSCRSLIWNGRGVFSFLCTGDGDGDGVGDFSWSGACERAVMARIEREKSPSCAPKKLDHRMMFS